MATFQNVLLVEDDAIIALGRTKELTRNGFQVETALTGKKAIERARTEPPPDLILMDIDLGHGRMDGTEAARTILAERDIPIVFLTSHSEQAMVDKVKGITRYGYVLKNSGEFVLKEAIRMASEIRDHQQLREAAYQQAVESEARLRRLNRILESTRKVSRIVTVERDRDRMLDRVCAALVETSGYSFSWIVLIENGVAREPFYHAGLGKRFDPIAEKLKTGWLPSCVVESLSHGGPVATGNTLPGCDGCPFAGGTPGQAGQTGLTVPISYDNTVFGFIRVSVPGDHVDEDEETRLFSEIANDTGYALFNLGVEESRRKTESRFAAITDSGAFSLINADVKTLKIRQVNNSITAFLGYSREELLAMRISELSDAEGNALDDTAFQEAYADGKDSYQIEKRFIRKDGSSAWGLLTVLIVRDDSGEPVEAMGLISDTSLRKAIDRKYRELFDMGVDAVYLLHENGDVLDANQAAARFLGRTHAEITNMNIGEIDRNFSPEEFREFWRNVPDGEVRVFETTHLRKDGTPVPVEVRGVVFTLNDERVLYGVARELSDDSQTRNLFRTLFQQASFGIGYYEPDGTVRFYNDYALSYRGLRADEVIGKHLTDLYPPEAAELYMGRIRTCLASEGSQPYEDRVSLPTGEYWFLTVYTKITDKAGGVLGVEIISSDITDRKNAELLLSEREQLLVNAQNIAGLGSWDWNVQTNETSWSDGLYQIYGRSPESGPTPLENWTDGIHPDDRQTLVNTVDRALETCGIYDTRYRIFRGYDGAVRWVHARGHVIRDDEGKALRLIGIVQDETEFRMLLHDKDIRLREAHHRVRNNLTTAIGLLRLQAANKPDSHCSEALLTAENRLLNMLALYQKLYTEPKEGAAPVGRYLKPLAEEMIAVFANRSAVTLETECDDFVLDSKTLTTMGIVINELVTNAMKHAFGGKPGTISIGVHHDGDEVELSVKDDGIGSAPEAPLPVSPSDGFGLFLVRSLAEQLSGSITIDGSDGTAVTIRFPHRSGGRQPSA